MKNYVILRVTIEEAAVIRDAAVAAKTAADAIVVTPLTPLADLKTALSSLAQVVIDMTKEVRTEL